MGILAVIFTFLAFASAYKTISIIVRKHLRATLTALDDISLLGIPRGKGRKVSGTAVVCGGSIAGLLSARVCADHIENVVMIEVDEYVTANESLNNDHHDDKSPLVVRKRPRVPQYSSFHAYQPLMTRALRKLFSNFDHEAVKTGASVIPVDAKWHFSGLPFKAPWHQYTAGNFPTITTLTRDGFETLLRRLVLATCPNVKYVPGAVVALVRSESSADNIDAVRIRSPAGEESSIPATLVIDCTGPARGGLKWLQNLSSASATRNERQIQPSSLETLIQTYDPKMGYTTYSFDVPPALTLPMMDLGFPEDFETVGFVYVNAPNAKKDNRNVLIARKGKSILQFVCGGWHVRERMTSIDDIKKFLSEMVVLKPIPDWIFRLLDLFEQEQVPSTYVYARCPASVYAQYHLAKNLPPNFVAIGDSVLTLNPIRGHGLTKACVEAVTLNALLTKCITIPTSDTKSAGNVLPKDFSEKYFQSQARRTGALWDLYKTGDYAWKSTSPAKGDSLDTGAWKRVYGEYIFQLAMKDRDVAAVVWHTDNWLIPSTDLFSPIIILKLGWMQVKSCFGL